MAGLIYAAPALAENCSDDKFVQVSKKELKTLISNKQVFVLDVNSESSFRENRIPTAIHFGSHQDTLATVLPKKKDSLIVAYCGGAFCTAWKKAARKACALGYTNVKHYKGGIRGWLEKDS